MSGRIMERIHGKGKRTLRGAPITSASIKPEAGLWRWIIRTAHSTHVDTGNYLTREEALAGLEAFLDAPQTARYGSTA